MDAASRKSPSTRSAAISSSNRKLLEARTSTRTLWPEATSWRATWLPTNPVAPVTSVVIKRGWPLVENQATYFPAPPGAQMPAPEICRADLQNPWPNRWEVLPLRSYNRRTYSATAPLHSTGGRGPSRVSNRSPESARREIFCGPSANCRNAPMRTAGMHSGRCDISNRKRRESRCR